MHECKRRKEEYRKKIAHITEQLSPKELNQFLMECMKSAGVIEQVIDRWYNNPREPKLAIYLGKSTDSFHVYTGWDNELNMGTFIEFKSTQSVNHRSKKIAHSNHVDK